MFQSRRGELRIDFAFPSGDLTGLILLFSPRRIRKQRDRIWGQRPTDFASYCPVMTYMFPTHSFPETVSTGGTFRSRPVESAGCVHEGTSTSGTRGAVCSRRITSAILSASSYLLPRIENTASTLDGCRYGQIIGRVSGAGGQRVCLPYRHLASISPSWQWMQLARDSRSTSRKRFRPYT